MNPYKIVDEFEKKMANFTGSKYAVAVDNCTNALFLCCKYLRVSKCYIPSKTYVSVPCAILNSGGSVEFSQEDWIGHYQIKPYPIFDYACELTKNMYLKDQFQCISFSRNKIVNIGKGGMIFTDNKDAVKWFKKARYEGRDEIPLLEQEEFDFLGWNMYMTPEQAARGIYLMANLKDKNIVINNYPDLSVKFKIKL